MVRADSGKNFKMAQYKTAIDQEIDLVLSKSRELIAIEIKSATKKDPFEVRAFPRIARALKTNKMYYISQDPIASEIKGVRCLHWKSLIKEIFL